MTPPPLNIVRQSALGKEKKGQSLLHHTSRQSPQVHVPFPAARHVVADADAGHRLRVLGDLSRRPLGSRSSIPAFLPSRGIALDGAFEPYERSFPSSGELALSPGQVRHGHWVRSSATSWAIAEKASGAFFQTRNRWPMHTHAS